MNMITTTLVGWILPVALGPIVYWVARQALNVHRIVDDAPPVLKRLVVGVLGVGIASALSALGVTLPAECVNLTTELADCATALNAAPIVEGVTAALVAIAIHAIKKSRPNE